jgi:antitoxin component of MazEF toxin-antitoxin module
MEQRIKETTVTRKNGGSTVITLSSAVKQVSGINLGDTVEIVAENGKLIVRKIAIKIGR